MAAGKIYSFYKELPSWAKGVVIIGGLGVTYLFASQVIKIVRADADKRKAEEGLKDSRDEQKKLEEQGLVASFPQSQFNGWVDSIVTQFDGCDIGSPLSVFGEVGIPLPANSAFWSDSALTIWKIISQFKNDLDFLALINTYSIREYDQCGWGTGNFKGNLYQAVKDELAQWEIDAINNKLKSLKINRQF
jgi:hypothetical protein